MHVVLVEVVPFEKLLDRVTPELLLGLLHGLGVLPFLIIYVIGVEVVNVDVGHVLRLHLARGKSVPVEVLEPRVLFQLNRASVVP